jgi:hypothetical protein
MTRSPERLMMHCTDISCGRSDAKVGRHDSVLIKLLHTVTLHHQYISLNSDDEHRACQEKDATNMTQDQRKSIAFTVLVFVVS